MSTQLLEKWKPVLDKEVETSVAFSPEAIQAQLLENTDQWCRLNARQLQMDESSVPGNLGAGMGDADTSPTGNTTANIATYRPILMTMAKRLPPNQIAFNFFGVQPMKAPDQQIFAMRARYKDGSAQKDNAEALFNEANAGFSGSTTENAVNVAGDTSGFTLNYITGSGDNTATTAPGGMTTATAEKLGTAGVSWNRMGVTIEKTSVEAKSRGLYADYSHELRQDMMAVHGQDVDTILSDILVTEIQAEMNREFIRKMNIAAVYANQGLTKAGVLDMAVDVSGRWAVEKWKYMLFQLEIEANQIAIKTRRGKGNVLLASANVASALAMAGMLDYTPALSGQASLKVDVTGQTYAGKLSNGMDLHIDPYASIDYITVAYKGGNQLDAGAMYCPYTPLEMYRANGEDSFQPRMAFKTRYGVTANPFTNREANGTKVDGLGAQKNDYFRKMAIKNLF